MLLMLNGYAVVDASTNCIVHQSFTFELAVEWLQANYRDDLCVIRFERLTFLLPAAGPPANETAVSGLLRRPFKRKGGSR